jgi:hypothetical protein
MRVGCGTGHPAFVACLFLVAQRFEVQTQFVSLVGRSSTQQRTCATSQPPGANENCLIEAQDSGPDSQHSRLLCISRPADRFCLILGEKRREENISVLHALT